MYLNSNNKSQVLESLKLELARSFRSENYDFITTCVNGILGYPVSNEEKIAILESRVDGEHILSRFLTATCKKNLDSGSSMTVSVFKPYIEAIKKGIINFNDEEKEKVLSEIKKETAKQIKQQISKKRVLKESNHNNSPKKQALGLDLNPDNNSIMSNQPAVASNEEIIRYTKWSLELQYNEKKIDDIKEIIQLYPSLLEKVVAPSEQTLLHIAASKNYEAIVKFCLELSPDLNIDVQDYDFKTPLDLIFCSVISSNQNILNEKALNIAGMLLSKNASRTTSYILNNVVTRKITDSEINSKMIDLLIKDASETDIISFLNAISKMSDDSPFFEQLCTEGFDVTIKDSDGNTPLHLLCKNIPNAKRIEMLLNMNAPIQEKNNNGQTPYQLLFASTNIKMLNLETINSFVSRCEDQHSKEFLDITFRDCYLSNANLYTGISDWKSQAAKKAFQEGHEKILDSILNITAFTYLDEKQQESILRAIVVTNAVGLLKKVITELENSKRQSRFRNNENKIDFSAIRTDEKPCHTLLHLSICYGSHKVLFHLVDRKLVNIDLTNGDGFTPIQYLFYAANNMRLNTNFSILNKMTNILLNGNASLLPQRQSLNEIRNKESFKTPYSLFFPSKIKGNEELKFNLHLNQPKPNLPNSLFIKTDIKWKKEFLSFIIHKNHTALPTDKENDSLYEQEIKAAKL